MTPTRGYEAFRRVASRERADDLRRRGFRGGVIPMHRALITAPSGRASAAQAAILSLALVFGWLVALRYVVHAWAATIEFWMDALGIAGYVTTVEYDIAGLYRFVAPYVHIRSEAPDGLQLMVGLVATVVLFVLSFVLGRRNLPIAYLMRVVVLFQASAQLFFWLVPGSFPYGAGGYLHAVLIAGAALVGIVPIALAFSYFIFDFNVWKKLGFALLLMAYMCVLVPMLYAGHAFVLERTSLLYLPILFFVFGLPLNVMAFVGMYSWGASWKGSLYEEDPPHGNGFFREEEAR